MLLQLRIDPTVSIGHIVTTLSVLVSVIALLISLSRDRGVRKKEQADKVRNAAARTMAKLERREELSLWFFEQIQPLIVETSEVLTKDFNISETRDFLWKGLNSARQTVNDRILDEEIEVAYVELYGYHPAIYQFFVTIIRRLKEVDQRIFDALLMASQKNVVAWAGHKDEYETAKLGDRLRTTSDRYQNTLHKEVEATLQPMRDFLLEIVRRSDDEILTAEALPEVSSAEKSTDLDIIEHRALPLSAYALLIGIDCYLPNMLPGGYYYPSLGGCVRDIALVEDFLQNKLGLSSDRIFTLTASNTGASEPPEPPEQWPTYKNLVAAFREVTEVAQPGDQVYIHYSGHGGRTTTRFPDLKGPGGRDEGLVPTDIGNSETQYLRDIELAHLLKSMVDKGLVVTVVLDSCHSGGATRGLGGAVTRGIGAVDTTLRPAESLVASDEELSETWRNLSEGATRNVKVGSGWLLEPQGYVLLTACRASESALEYPFDGEERNGVLTYWLLDSLKQAGPGLTYKVLHDRVLAKVHSRFAEQTPQLEGEGSRIVFGSDQTSRVDQRLAVEETTERLRSDYIERGAQTVLLDPGPVRLRRAVRLVSPEDPTLQAVRSVLSQSESSFVRLAEDEEPADFQVAVNNEGEYEIWDPAGAEIANLRPVLKVDVGDAPVRVVQRLEHLAKYRNVQELDNRDPMSPLARKLVVELAGKQSEYDPADEPAPQPFDDPGRTPTLGEGEWTFLRVRNTLSPGAEDDPSRILNVTVLDLQPDWGITQIYPSGAGAFEPLDPGQEVLLPLRARLPHGYPEGTDVIKIFATVETIDFRWLELPPLDKLIIRSSRLEDGPRNPLEELLANVAEKPATRNVNPAAYPSQGAPTTRNVNPAAYLSQGWVTAQVEVRVQRQEA